MTRRRLIEAINDTMFHEMERNPKIVVYGEDVELSILGDLRGLHSRFGHDRIRNTPICEATLTGMAVGLAAAGYHPVLHMMFSNFLYTGMDAIANQIAKLRLMTGGQMTLPITIMASYGAGRSSAAQHSDTPYPALMNLGGIHVLTPATPADARGLLTSALRSPNPSIFLEPAGRGGDSGDVPDGEHLVEFGSASILREGTDVTLLAIGRMVKIATKAADTLAEDGIDVELIDPRTLVPFDTDSVLTSVAKTGRLVIVDESRECCSAASQIAALVVEHGFDSLRAPIRRVTTPNVAMPYAPGAEAHLLPDEARITTAVTELASIGRASA